MRIAVEGCCHGELDATYGRVQALENTHNYTVDLLLICGDFQAIRNRRDLQCMSVPVKYKQLGTFWKYYTGEKVAPVLTLVIGGNQEASNYMWELYHGGWLAPNIYFLGHAGCVQVDGIRIAGASGVSGGNVFRQGNWEKVPYDRSSIRSIYHIREFNIRRLSLLTHLPSPLTVILSHDWPQSIAHYGDLSGLLRQKAVFRADIESGKLGSPPLWGLLKTITPEWWFAAHLHVRFEALVQHREGEGEAAQVEEVKVANSDDIVIDGDGSDLDGDGGAKLIVEEEMKAAPVVDGNADEIALDEVAPAPIGPPATKFLALDNCLPRRQFLEVVEVPTPPAYASTLGHSHIPRLTYDPEWLAITRAFHPYLSTARMQPVYPDEAEARELIREAGEWVKQNVRNVNVKEAEEGKEGEETGGHTYVAEECVRNVEDCQNFVMTAPGSDSKGDKNAQPLWYTNPQTEAFCQMIGVPNKINPPPVGLAAAS
ncbi:DBR1-domain-containing protein [Athelia psychrophila]|uniref:DBR1-domain-containing protein n=1 Tax=Athelia psychrophila TaxID=1759441 RepID=A0A166QEH2_9AGAM|nr:DBR1-domain-containing protein [Fibularhizoctonia sp. CBS 109695]